MQVSVEKTSDLNRKMTISFSEEIVQEKMDARFKSLARTAKVDGFRPGKVPLRVVKKMYSDRVKGEIAGDLIKSTYYEALQEQQLDPVGQPHIHTTDTSDGFEYIAEFEVYPEVSLEQLPELEIIRSTATVEQADMDAMVARLRDQQKEWSDVEGVSEKGDRLTLNFSGVCEDENFTEGRVENHTIEIGSGQMIPGFEDQLLGLEASTNKTLNVTFPEDYGNEKVAGKPAEFEVEVTKVERSSIPALDEKFIIDYGVNDGTEDSFYANVKSSMERELQQGLKEKLKNVTMDALYEKIKISVPKALVDQEIQNLIKPYEAHAKKQNVKVEDLNLSSDTFELQAHRRVALGLLIREIIQTNKIAVDDEQVRSTIENLAKSYENPDEFVDWYYGDEKRLNEIKQMVLEDQVVSWIVDHARVTDNTVSFDDIMEKKTNTD